MVSSWIATPLWSNLMLSCQHAWPNPSGKLFVRWRMSRRIKKIGIQDQARKSLDLLHPSLFPLIYGRSRALPSGTVLLEDCSLFIGKGEPVDPPLADGHRFHRKREAWDYETSLKAWGSFQWLPSNVTFSEGGWPRITSYINNLHPQTHRYLYGILERTTCGNFNPTLERVLIVVSETIPNSPSCRIPRRLYTAGRCEISPAPPWSGRRSSVQHGRRRK